MGLQKIIFVFIALVSIKGLFYANEFTHYNVIPNYIKNTTLKPMRRPHMPRARADPVMFMVDTGSTINIYCYPRNSKHKIYLINLILPEILNTYF